MNSTGGVPPEGPNREEFSMPSVLAYHRPESLDEAQKLASEKNAVLIGGGTLVIPAVLSNPSSEAEIIDLQSVGLTGIFPENEGNGTSIRIGAMSRLSDLINSEEIPHLLRELCNKELPSTLRTQATVGGTIADRSGESILLSGLLALNAEIQIHEKNWVPLTEYLGSVSAQGIITAVKFHKPSDDSKTCFHSVGRTPMDIPIISAIGYSESKGNVQVSFTGVAEVPTLVSTADEIANLNPQGDFRGSGDYRKHLASVLYTRIQEEMKA